jgi:hypothetical protein
MLNEAISAKNLPVFGIADSYQTEWLQQAGE